MDASGADGIFFFFFYFWKFLPQMDFSYPTLMWRIIISLLCRNDAQGTEKEGNLKFLSIWEESLFVANFPWISILNGVNAQVL